MPMNTQTSKRADRVHVKAGAHQGCSVCQLILISAQHSYFLYSWVFLVFAVMVSGVDPFEDDDREGGVFVCHF